MVKVIWSPQALDDIDSIAQYIEHSSPKFAKQQVQKFFTKAKQLEEFPMPGRMVPEVDNPIFRELVLDNVYRIIYRIINNETLGIITVHHSSRPLNLKNMSLDSDPLHFLIHEIFPITQRPYFVIAGELGFGTIKSGMWVKHKDHQVKIKSIEMLDSSKLRQGMMAFILEFQNDIEKDLFNTLFLKGDIIEIFSSIE